MQQTSTEINLILIAGTLVMLVVFVFIFLFVILYERRRLNHKVQLHEMEMANQKKMLEAIIATQENEKEQFAAELHDSLSQMLTTLLMNLNTMESRLKEGDIDKPAILKQINSMQELNKQSINETRNISRKLMPVVLNDFGLFDAITDMCYKINESGKLQINYYYEGEPERLPGDIEKAVFRITQELLNNTIKYADARKASIDIKNKTNKLVYIYTDDGVGMDVEEKKGKGLGLISMESRVSALNGSIVFTSEKNKGIRVDVTIPVV